MSDSDPGQWLLGLASVTIAVYGLVKCALDVGLRARVATCHQCPKPNFSDERTLAMKKAQV